MPDLLKKLLRDEKGTVDVQTLLVIGAVVLPIVVMLLIFKNKLLGFLWEKTEDTVPDIKLGD